MTVDEAFEALRDPQGDTIFLDTNAPRAAAPYVARYLGRWVNIPYEQLAGRLGELPRERRVVTICDCGLRDFVTLPLIGRSPGVRRPGSPAPSRASRGETLASG